MTEKWTEAFDFIQVYSKTSLPGPLGNKITKKDTIPKEFQFQKLHSSDLDITDNKQQTKTNNQTPAEPEAPEQLRIK